MFRLAAWLLLVLTPSFVVADAFRVGQRVIVKLGAKGKIGNSESNKVTRPATVKELNGNWLWLGQAWFQKHDVLTIDQALDFYSELLKENPTAAYWHIRAIAWMEKGDYEKAIKDFTESIRLDSQSASSFIYRGSLWLDKGEYDKAIEDFTETIRLEPKNAMAYFVRGNAWDAKGSDDKAIQDYTVAIRLNPEDGAAYNNRGNVFGDIGDYKRALADFSEAIRLDPRLTEPYHNIARLRATCPSEDFRDGKEAIEFAKVACEHSGWKSYETLDTLAAAYAESGDFENAKKWQKKAVDLAPIGKKPKLLTQLVLYEQGKPYREQPKKK